MLSLSVFLEKQRKRKERKVIIYLCSRVWMKKIKVKLIISCFRVGGKEMKADDYNFFPYDVNMNIVKSIWKIG